jgi:hypothetical protein
MQSTNLKTRIDYLKDVLANFNNEEKKLIGVTIIRENSSDNWLFNTEVDITSIVPTVCTALEKEIAQLEEELKPILAAEQEAERIRLEQEAIAEAERLKQEQAEAELNAKLQAQAQAKDLGNKLVNLYLLDNSELNLTTQQTLQQLQKFAAIKQLLELGSLRAAKDLIMMAEVDEIFTEERKAKYLSYL